MRFARIGEAGRERPVVLDEAGKAYDISGLTAEIDGTFLSGDGPARVAAALAAGSLAETPLDGVRYGPPVARPGKIVCIGLNYVDHAEETGSAKPGEPIIFMKAPNVMVGPDDTVLIPRRSEKTDYEVELAIVIGKEASYLESPEDADAVIAGYAIADDVSEREFQAERGGTWDKGKNCATFLPLGPWLVTPDEAGDPQELALRTKVNGEVRQDGNTKNMIFGVRHIVWYVSQFMVLEPGDIIPTGTPAGVGFGNNDFPFLKPGDVVEMEIDNLGRQRHSLAQA